MYNSKQRKQKSNSDQSSWKDMPGVSKIDPPEDIDRSKFSFEDMWLGR